MSKNLLDEIDDKYIPPPLPQPRLDNLQLPKSTIPRRLRQDFNKEFIIMDQVLQTEPEGELGCPGIALHCRDRREALTHRIRFYNARQAHREANKDTELETQYDRLLFTVDGKILNIAIRANLLKLPMTTNE